jgi:hypothetical protein
MRSIGRSTYTLAKCSFTLFVYYTVVSLHNNVEGHPNNISVSMVQFTSVINEKQNEMYKANGHT